MKNTVVVTGGAGFIGSHLVELLVMQGAKVLVVDNLSSGSLDNLALVMDKIDFIKSDVECFDFNDIKNITSVVHLAAQTSVPYSIENFFESSKTNLLSTTKIIDYCSKNSIPLVYATSSAVYGGLDFGDDKLASVDLTSPYAVDKYVMELYAKCSSSLYGLSSIGLRFFNVYGPRQDPSSPYSGVITLFINKLMKNSPVTVNGGFQTRDFVYVNDVCLCIMNALNKVMNFDIQEVVNVLTGFSISINFLLSNLQNLMPNNSVISYNELPLGDPEKSNGCVDNMTSLLQINPDEFMSIEKGLTKTIEYFKQTK